MKTDIATLSHFKCMNVKIRGHIVLLPDRLRKEIRLLEKQYEILEILRDPSEDIEGNNPVIIKYKNRGGNEIFEWEIEIK